MASGCSGASAASSSSGNTATPFSIASVPGWTFFVFRFSRLYPLHLATLVAVAILQSLYFRMHGCFFVYQNNDIRHFLLQLLMASKWGFESGDSFNGPIWSISVEVLVYVVFFLMLRFVTRSPLLNVVVVVACLNLSGQIFSCLAFFYAGGLAAIARRADRHGGVARCDRTHGLGRRNPRAGFDRGVRACNPS